jgi:multidrug efflux pump subunit AcrA (membrane-fusion protein)
MFRTIFVIGLFVLLLGCAHKKEEEPSEDATATITPVTVTKISEAPMAEYLDLNATSTYLLKNVIKANTNGYLKQSNAVAGKYLNTGDLLFTLKTKEAETIGNAVNSLDSSFKFSGTITIKAPAPGFITEVNHQLGDYVQDGEQLAVMSDMKSFVFVLNLPYELRPYVLGKRDVLLTLPDGKSLRGRISSVTPIVDSSSQTQGVYIAVDQTDIPVNVLATVRIEKVAKSNAASLPKPAVLADEMQKNYWVMKLLNDSTAVRVPVTKGIETEDRVEILSPKFSTSDKFLLTGNFGLPDTAKVKIVQ